MHQRGICLYRQIPRPVALHDSILINIHLLASRLRLGQGSRWSRNLQLSTDEHGSGGGAETAFANSGELIVSTDDETRDESARPKWAEEVYTHDLTATLEAHRTTNRALQARRAQSLQYPPFKKLLIGSGKVGPDAGVVTENGSTENAHIDDGTAQLHSHQATNHALSSHRAQRDASSQKLCLRTHYQPEASSLNSSVNDKSEEATSAVKSSETDTHESALGVKSDGGGLESESGRIAWVKSHWPADSPHVLNIAGKRHRSKTHGVLEYKACWLPPQGKFNIGDNVPQRPYLAVMANGGKTRAGDSLQRLHDELKAYETYMEHSAIEKEASRILISDIRGLIAKRYPHNPLLVIGSCGTGLADRLSDIDLALSFPDLEKKPFERGPSSLKIKNQKRLKRALFLLQAILDRSNLFQGDVELIHARVPIVRAEHRATGLRVELQTLFPHNIAQEYVASYLAEYPTLRTLFIIFRSALHIRYLNNVHLGGLGSYPTLIMIVNALKHASGRFASDDLASQFLYILDFYGNADLYKYGFSPDPPRQFLKQKEGRKMTAEEKDTRMQDPMLRGIEIMNTFDGRKPYLLCLQDPADPTNDLGKRAYGIKHVQEMFRKFSQQLKDQMKEWDEGKDDQNPYGLLGNFLEASYSALDYQRRKMRKWLTERDPSLVPMLEVQFPPEQYRLRSKEKRAIKRDKQTIEHLAAVRNEQEKNRSLLQGGQQQPGESWLETGTEELQAIQPDTDLKNGIPQPDVGSDLPIPQKNHEQPEVGSIADLKTGFSSPDSDTDVQMKEEDHEQPKKEPRWQSQGDRGWKRWTPGSDASASHQQDQNIRKRK